MTPIVIYRNGGFGDRLLAAQAVSVLNDHGIVSLFWDADPAMRDLVTVPIYTGGDAVFWWWEYRPERQFDGRSLLEKSLDHICDSFGYPHVPVTIPYVPVKYQDDPGIPHVDIAICSRTGDFTPYRNWPHFQELKLELDRRGTSWVDLSERKIECNAALNWAAKSRLYLGLETGMSHYVAGVVDRGLILQSGYAPMEYWASTYSNFELLAEQTLPCRGCFRVDGCPIGHECMRELPVDLVMGEIERMLNENPNPK